MSITSASSSSTESKRLKPSSRTSTKTKSPPPSRPRSPKPQSRKLPPPDEDQPGPITSRPPDTARGTSPTWQETQSLSRRVTSKVHRINLAKMWDNVRLADKRGNIDERTYEDLISFFFGFVPMVLNTHPRDPCVVTGSELLVYRELMRVYEDRGDGRRRMERVVRGEGRVHEWYTRPKEKRGGILGRLFGR